jgi:hypothetical protein
MTRVSRDSQGCSRERNRATTESRTVLLDLHVSETGILDTEDVFPGNQPGMAVSERIEHARIVKPQASVSLGGDLG